MSRKQQFAGAAAILMGIVTAFVINHRQDQTPPSPKEMAPSNVPTKSTHASNASADAIHEAPATISLHDTPRKPKATAERPRPSTEWQGMKVDDADTWPCHGEASNQCSMARACIDGECVPCVQDGDCNSGEVCVLDHCVLEKFTECRRTADCAPGSMCILTGYTSSDLRGNSDMHALCSNPEGGMPAERLSESVPDVPQGFVAAQAEPKAQGSSILEQLRARAR